MTINCAKAISYCDMQHLFKKKQYEWFQLLENPEDLKNFAKTFNNIWIVSIRDPEVEPIFKIETKHYNNVLQLSFNDVFYDNPNPTEEMKRNCIKDGWSYPLKSQAKEIFDFIKKAHESSKTSNDLLLVNCMMGISRSGAIVDFAIDYCDLNRPEIMNLNNRIRPNKFLKKLLLEEASKQQDSV